MPQLKRDYEVKTAIVRVLREKGSLGYNMLYEEVHRKIRCGRNQFSKYLKELGKELVVSSRKSPIHKVGVALELGQNAFKYVQSQQFQFFAESLLSVLLPFAKFRETGSIEEQLATYDLSRLLPFKIRIQLTSEASGKRIVAEGTLRRDGSISDSRIIAA